LLGALSLLIGLLAVFAAIRVRGPLVAQLGRGWLIRFLVVQGGLINAVLLWVVLSTLKGFSWSTGAAAWGIPLGYGALFYVYSLSNIDWTAKKFHSEGG
jgi:hypothetical protein